MSHVKYTKTATFLFPLLDIKKSVFSCDVKDVFKRPLFSSRFLNAFLYDEDVDKYQENHVFLLTRNYRDVDFDSFYTTMKAFPNYVDDYEKGDFLIFIFKIPDATIIDFHLLLKGKYSEISNESKNLIYGNHYYNGESSTLPLIMTKSNALKQSWEKTLSHLPNSIVDLGNQEVWSIIIKEEEKLCVDKYKSLVKIKDAISIKNQI